MRRLADVGADYEFLYKTISGSRRVFHATRPSSISPRQVLRVAALIPAGPEGWQAPGYLRVVLPLRHAVVADRVVLTVPRTEALLAHAHAEWPDAVIVERNALPPDLLQSFMSACHERGTPILLDMDDNLFDAKAIAAEQDTYQPAVATMEHLARYATAVSVSTESLAEIMRGYNSEVHLLPNALDEKLWFAPTNQSGEAAQQERSHQLNVLYYGTYTHAGDLAVIRPAIARLRAEGLPIELFLIGGQQDDGDNPWYRRVAVPPGKSLYPEFALWLRGLAGQWNLGVAPLADTVLNRSKSLLKYMEYTALGLPVVASNIGPYRVLQHRVNALLCKNTIDDWCEQLRQLATDQKLRHTLHRNAMGNLTSRYLLKHHSERLLALLEALVESHHPGRGPTTSARGSERRPAGAVLGTRGATDRLRANNK